MYMHAAAYALLTFFVSFIYDLIIEFVFRVNRQDSSWTFLKWIIVTLGLVFCIAVGNYILVCFLYNQSGFHLAFFFQMVLNTLSIAVIPIFFIGALHLNRKIGSHKKIAKDITLQTNRNNTPVKEVVVSEKLEPIRIHQFCYAEAMQNYVAIYTFENNLMLKSVHRTTLTALQNKLEEYGIIKCHRSYLVNPDKITSITGNAQGLKLEIQSTTQLIPVSRKYIPKIKAI